MNRRFGVTFVLVATLFTALSLVAQDDLRVDVRLVNIIATVTDSRGHYANNLTAEDFVVEEDGVRQQIAHFSQDQDVPVSIGIVLDTSGSMDQKIRTAKAAVERFVRQLEAEDEIFLMTFSGNPSLRQDFTSDRQRITRALGSIRATGGTALYDALSLGLRKIQTGRHDKRALLVITDGQDTNSSATAEQVNSAIRQSELLVYSLGIEAMTYGERGAHIPFTWPLPGVLGGRSGGGQRDVVNMSVLRQFALSSGGRALLLSDSYIGGRSSELEEVLTQIATELRGQYTLGYYPSSADDGRFHNIRVRTSPGYVVRARTGYLASEN